MHDMVQWEQDGNIQVIKGTRDSRGLWSFPPGTIVPKDPTTMARMVAISNAAGEHFHCLLPARTKELNHHWIDVPQVPVVEDIDVEDAEKSLR
jgi:hypothetical protein